jgi:hypothetical protein
MIKLLTCQTWVTEWDWFVYAQRHPEQVPFLLVDRSPCTDPFLDPYTPSKEERRLIISGLCRVNQIKKYLRQGNTFIFITRVDHRVCRKLKIPTADERHTYLGIAALKIVREHASHEDAAKTFTSRRYIVAPDPTLYPPNLAHDLSTRVAVLRENCIVSLKRGNSAVHYTPDCSTDAQWWEQVKSYYVRQKKNKLPAAECCLVQVGGLEAIQLDPAHAPIFTPADWGGKQMNLPGIELQAAKADQLCQRIARGR